ncbi:hypothetical protein MMC18_001356 [Xylographa bjoerkii]|nr:hypothetical protein [Xylographa bjoerkii]
MKAVTILENRTPGLVEIKEQSMRHDYFKVKTVALAINPTDGDHTAFAGPVGGILGCDLAGIVEEIGEKCESHLMKGDKIYGVCHCGNNNNLEDGAFAEYAMVKDGHLAKIPESMSFEDCVTLGVGVTTVGQTLYMSMNLPLPTEPAKEPFPILISGGASATGTLTIQFAKLSGLKVITTCSPKHFDLVKSLGADVVFDYHDIECGKKIRAETQNSLRYVLDCICTESTFGICADALSSDSSQTLEYMGLLPVDAFPRKDVNARAILAYTTFGEAFEKFGQSFPPIPPHFEFGVKWWKLAADLLAKGKIRPHPAIIREGGLAGIVDGIKEMQQQTVSGAKLVYHTADTPADAREPIAVSNDAEAANPRFTGKW